MLGVCYYPEHWPPARWPEDARLMRAAGLELVRIGEFAWSRLEPQPGVYDWDWLDRAIATLSAAGLRVILGTPTATPPAWLTQRYPEVLRVGADGRRWSHGGRRHTCPTSPAYREHCQRIVTALAERYGHHPAVIAWQIDNELGNHSTARCACPTCRAAFQQWCTQRYATLEQLNARWGTVFWSQEYSDWRQIPLPSDPVGGGHNPALALAYRRFASEANIDLLRAQTAILRALAPGRLLTTNIAPLDDEIDWHRLAAEVDVISWDNYPHGFEHPADVAFFHDLVRGLKRQPFWVMEQQPGRINWTAYNPPVPPGQVRLWTYQALAHGAEHVLFFRWRAGRVGQEQYHSGLLRHDATPAQGYHEVARLARELAEQPLPPRAPAQVALLISYEDAWSVQLEPHHAAFDYWRVARLIYRDFWRRGIAVDVIRRDQELDGYRQAIAVVPMLIDAADTARWQTFVERGGHLTLTGRACVRDQDLMWSDQPLPHGLSELLGAQVSQWYALPPGTQALLRQGDADAGTTHTWIEELAINDAARVTVPFLAQLPAYPTIAPFAPAAEARLGRGALRYLSCYPADPDAGWWSAWPTPPAPLLPPDVEAVPLADGSRLLLNHSPTAPTPTGSAPPLAPLEVQIQPAPPT